jgi:hypothetical protein
LRFLQPVSGTAIRSKDPSHCEERSDDAISRTDIWRAQSRVATAIARPAICSESTAKSLLWVEALVQLAWPIG